MSDWTRREFLQDVLLAAAAAALPLPGCGKCAPGAGESARGDTLRVAVIGVGGFGAKRHVAQWLARPDCEIAYVCDADSRIGRRQVARIAKKTKRAAPRFVQDMRRIF